MYVSLRIDSGPRFVVNAIFRASVRSRVVVDPQIDGGKAHSLFVHFQHIIGDHTVVLGVRLNRVIRPVLAGPLDIVPSDRGLLCDLTDLFLSKWWRLNSQWRDSHVHHHITTRHRHKVVHMRWLITSLFIKMGRQLFVNLLLGHQQSVQSAFHSLFALLHGKGSAREHAHHWLARHQGSRGDSAQHGHCWIRDKVSPIDCLVEYMRFVSPLSKGWSKCVSAKLLLF